MSTSFWKASPASAISALRLSRSGRGIAPHGLAPARRMLAFRGDYEEQPVISFAGFVISLATTAAVHFGDFADPTTGEREEPNLLAAHQMIELIALLQEKTKGNLTADEAKLVDDLLYELRMRFVQAQQGERRIIEP